MDSKRCAADLLAIFLALLSSRLSRLVAQLGRRNSAHNLGIDMLMLRKNEKPEYVKPGQIMTGRRCDAVVLDAQDCRQEYRDWLRTCVLCRPDGDANSLGISLP